MKTKINKKQFKVWLPNKMFKNLKTKVREYNGIGEKPKLELSISAYLLNLMFYIPLKANDKYEDGWIPICSRPYKNLKYFKNYMEFLVNNNFIIANDKNYSNCSKSCKKYKINGNYKSQQVNFHDVPNGCKFIKNIIEKSDLRKKTADDKCGHLTKWLKPELLSIDSKKALKKTNENYIKKSDLGKKNKRIYTIKSIESKSWNYSREGEDNRLHTILTSLPKDLRSYIKYNKEVLVSLDISNSQPFIISTILNQIIKSSLDFNLMNSFINKFYKINSLNNLYISTMSDHSKEAIIEINYFINNVINGTFYELYSNVLFKEKLLFLDIDKQCVFLESSVNNDGKYNSHRFFKSKRKASKYIILKTLFSSVNCHHSFIKVFQKEYPNVFKFIQKVKKGKEKNFFPILLQNIEADCILDYCTKNIAKKHPEMPLFTIHDSIITTLRYKDELEKEFKKCLKLYFSLEPKITCEIWSEDYLIAS